jgi:serine/threonine protein kinase
MEGLEYLHEFVDPKIIHRDIKTANILLNKRNEAKLSDFGISRPILEGGHPPTQVMGTRGYVDPE